jgi:hypothetical protein
MAMGAVETASVPVGRVGPKVDDTETISSSETVARRVEILGDGRSTGESSGGFNGLFLEATPKNVRLFFPYYFGRMRINYPDWQS